MSWEMIAVLLIVLAVAAEQWWLWTARPPRALVGDENEYLARAAADDPFRPVVFLRPPWMPALARLLRTEARVRAAGASAGVLSVWLAMVAAAIVAGPVGAIVAGLLLALVMERAVLGQRIFPDTWLTLWLAVIQLVLVSWHGPAAALACGAVCAIAVSTRLEQLALVPGCLMALHAGVIDAALLCAPVALALAAWTWHNGTRYGRWTPDDTWRFNLRVAAGDDDPATPINEVVARQIPHRIDVPLPRPTAVLRMVPARMRVLLGPDSFVSERLLERGYGDASWPLFLRVGLRLAAPVAVGALAASAVLAPEVPPFAWPGLWLAAAFVAVHTRTRYRQPLWQMAALWVVWAVTRSGGEGALIALCAGALVALLIISLPARHEVLDGPCARGGL